jgi:hypothetical protein
MRFKKNAVIFSSLCLNMFDDQTEASMSIKFIAGFSS